ncbi:hypothetical protein [Cytobacillus kochii]|uniref:hypothetical protein n=1 Tax=Cytobacillus kochii TaxID=859143 RepID=UPI00203CA326|nr:hypothetical protein [Cytobacillus kochii]MCM3322262.1 hypothetical protein [Cytobacillus kochii]MCM3345259.1 hypothetical protein [Cytobacillus kochii]
MDNNPSVINATGGELTYNNSTKINKNNEVSVPAELIDTVNKIIRENINDINVQLNKDKIDGLWKITIKPEFQNGIDTGSLSIKKGSLEIRNAKTGRFAGKAQLNEMTTEELIKKNKPSALSNISRNIASISGQIQMAEISKKLDAIHEKIDQLGQFLWKEKVSMVHSINSVIEEAIESLPNKNAMVRINDCIKDLKFLSDFIEETIEEVLSRKIEYKLIQNFLDGLKVWEWRSKYRNEYNKKYNDEIQLFMHEYSFLLDLYFQTLGLIGTCYQITDEYHHASKYYRKIETKINYYSTELVSKLIYLLNVDGISINDDVSLLHIGERLKNRKLPKIILQEINSNEIKVDEVKNMYKRLVTQFEEIQISFDVDTQLFLGDINND